MTGNPEPADRFDRQVRFAPLGVEGQARLADARVLLVGCGALGGVLAQSFARAGVGTLVLVDRDVVELTNLPRQVLFDEGHARDGVVEQIAGQVYEACAASGISVIGGHTEITHGLERPGAGRTLR